MAKSKYSTLERRAYWTGFGARLVRVGKRGSNNLLKGYYNGKQGTSFKNGVSTADKFVSRYKY